MGRFAIGARVRDPDGDEGVIVRKRKGERQVEYESTALEGYREWWFKDELEPVVANDNSVEEAADGAAKWVPQVGDRVRFVEPYGGHDVGDEVVLTSVEVAANPVNGYLVSYFDGFVYSIRLEPVVTEEERADAGGGFKAGDRIRLIANELPGMPLGSEYVAVGRTTGHQNSVHFIGDDGYTTWRPGSYFEIVDDEPVVEQWTPKVGDRVRTDGGYTFDPSEGLIETAGAGLYEVRVNDGLWLYERDEIELLPAVTIEAGKFYRTRDGRKVGPAIIDGDIAVFGWRSNHASAVWVDNGRQSNRGDLTTELDNDIVAEWVDEVVGEEPKIKFKVGDRIRRVSNPYCFVPRGYETEVLEIDDEDNLFYIDAEGDRMASDPNDWELVTTNTTNNITLTLAVDSEPVADAFRTIAAALNRAADDISAA